LIEWCERLAEAEKRAEADGKILLTYLFAPG